MNEHHSDPPLYEEDGMHEDEGDGEFFMSDDGPQFGGVEMDL